MRVEFYCGSEDDYWGMAMGKRRSSDQKETEDEFTGGQCNCQGKEGRFQRMAIRKPMSEKGMMGLRRWGWIKPKKIRQTGPEGDNGFTCIQWESPEENKRSGYGTIRRKNRFNIFLFC